LRRFTAAQFAQEHSASKLRTTGVFSATRLLKVVRVAKTTTPVTGGYQEWKAASTKQSAINAIQEKVIFRILHNFALKLCSAN